MTLHDVMHRFLRHAAAAAAMLCAVAAQAELADMTSEEMTDVSGQNGIAFEWDLRVNSDAAGNLNTTLCPAANRVQCRLAVKFANRNDNGGEWLVWKGYSGRIYFPKLWLDATTSSASATPYADTARFVSGTGSLVSPYNKLNLLFRLPAPMQIYNYSIRGMAVEYGSGLSAGTGFQADPTDSSSFIGLTINNSVAGQPATIRFDGTMQWFGF